MTNSITSTLINMQNTTAQMQAKEKAAKQAKIAAKIAAKEKKTSGK